VLFDGDEELRASITSRLRQAGSVFAEDEASLLLSEAGTFDELERMVGQRLEGKPLEYIVGWVDFLGHRFALKPGVFVPRARSELVVVEALALVKAGDVVVDLCCGSGALGASVLRAFDEIEIYAADIDPIAVGCAQENFGLREDKVFTSDLFSDFPDELRGRVSLLICNAPYVPSGSLQFLPGDSRLHESAVSLDGGIDGLDVHRRVLEEAQSWLSQGAHLIVETNPYQVDELVKAFDLGRFRTRVANSSELEAMVVIGTFGSAV
jgi:release factor glutamine methyltransferase